MNFFSTLLEAIRAYLSSFGNKSAVIEAVFDETKKEVKHNFTREEAIADLDVGPYAGLFRKETKRCP